MPLSLSGHDEPHPGDLVLHSHRPPWFTCCTQPAHGLCPELSSLWCDTGAHAPVSGFPVKTRDLNCWQYGSVCSLLSVVPEIMLFPSPGEEMGTYISKVGDRAVPGACLGTPHGKLWQVPIPEMPPPVRRWWPAAVFVRVVLGFLLPSAPSLALWGLPWLSLTSSLLGGRSPAFRAPHQRGPRARCRLGRPSLGS